MKIYLLEDSNQKSLICNEILGSLPQWFGIEESLVEYNDKVKDLDFFVAEDTSIIGFVAVKTFNFKAIEIIVMGIKPDYHHQGIGKKLMAYIDAYYLDKGYNKVSVLTLADTHPDIYYGRTRKFYQSVGFSELMVLPDHWDEANPCLVMYKELKEEE